MSTELPFLQMMMAIIDSMPKAQQPENTWEIRRRLKGHLSSSQLRSKPMRPCIVLKRRGQRERAEETDGICLMATFDGQDITELPAIYRDVLVAGTTRPWLHSCPEWSSKHPQWIIPLRIALQSGSCASMRHWKSREMNCGAHFCRDELAQLEEEALSVTDVWTERLSRDPLFLASMFKDMKECKVRASQTTASTMNHSMASTRTNTSRVDSLITPVNRPLPVVDEVNFPSLRSPLASAPTTSPTVATGGEIGKGTGLSARFQKLRIRISSSRLSLRGSSPRSPHSSSRTPSIRGVGAAESILPPDEQGGWTTVLSKTEKRRR
ncbi:hypothetical protein R3P38DRAFT_3348327 [Favolaschia claudopus]|uniref:Uncharacterized protein n=1 Tax=Favolaschia claudopus TaxID=2862362 RepID=A0AAW0CQI6_9AGAR